MDPYEGPTEAPRKLCSPTIPRTRSETRAEINSHHKRCFEEYQQPEKLEKHISSPTIPRKREEKEISTGTYHSNCFREFTAADSESIKRSSSPTIPRRRPDKHTEINPYHEKCFHPSGEKEVKPHRESSPTVPKSRPEKNLDPGKYHQRCFQLYEPKARQEIKISTQTQPREIPERHKEVGKYHVNCFQEYDHSKNISLQKYSTNDNEKTVETDRHRLGGFQTLGNTEIVNESDYQTENIHRHVTSKYSRTFDIDTNEETDINVDQKITIDANLSEEEIRFESNRAQREQYEKEINVEVEVYDVPCDNDDIDDMTLDTVPSREEYFY